jgi:two-component system CheB/CheR fusion protein
MKRLASVLTFLFLLLVIVEFRLKFVDPGTSNSSFVFMLLITVLGSLYWGFLTGLLLLLVTSGLIGYFFLTPNNVYLLSQGELKQIGLFILEGLVILFFINMLRKSKEQEHEMRERFQVILASIGDAVIATDKRGVIQYMNATSQRVTEWKYRDAHHKNLSVILHLEDKDELKLFNTSMKQVLEEGKSVYTSKPVMIRSKNGTLIDMQNTIAPLKNMEGNIIGTVLIFRDVTAHRELEEQKEVLLGSISHELKNYITSIQGYTHIVNKKVKETNNEQLIDFTGKLSDKVETMKNMVISMLDLSKLKMGKLDMRLEEFDLEDLITSTIHDLELNTGHVIKMKGVLEVHVLADKLRIGQVLMNLISNAIKYSPDNKEIHIILKQNDDEAVVGVRDFGQGIPEHKMDKMFKPFYRAGDAQEKSSIAGSGLGLYISREIVKQNNGKIWVKSEVGKGSTFYFSLPAIPITTEQSATPREENPLLGIIKKLLKFRPVKR